MSSSKGCCPTVRRRPKKMGPVDLRRSPPGLEPETLARGSRQGTELALTLGLRGGVVDHDGSAQADRVLLRELLNDVPRLVVGLEQVADDGTVQGDEEAFDDGIAQLDLHEME